MSICGPSNIFKDVSRSDDFEVIIIFDPKEDINTAYFEKLIEDYSCTIYISEEYEATLIRKYLDSIDTRTIYTTSYELEDLLSDKINSSDIFLIDEEDS